MKLYEVRTKSLRDKTGTLLLIFLVAVECRHHSKTQPPGCHVMPPRVSQRHGDWCSELGGEGTNRSAYGHRCGRVEPRKTDEEREGLSSRFIKAC